MTKLAVNVGTGPAREVHGEICHGRNVIVYDGPR